MTKISHILEFDNVDREDLNTSGDKGANLGEMVKAGFPIPPGFIISTSAYFQFLEENDFKKQLKNILLVTNINDPQELQDASKKIKNILEKGKISEELAREIRNRYRKLGSMFSHALVVVKSSAIAENLTQESFLNIRGDASLLFSVRKCWSSLFTPQAIFYLEQKKYNFYKVGVAVVVQEMVQAEISGVAFTQDPHGEDKHKMVIEAVWGLGEALILGKVIPDYFELERHSLMITNKIIPPQEKQKLEDSQIKRLGKLLQKIQNYYFFPQDVEWVYKKGKFFIIQSRPITTLNNKNKTGNIYQKEEKTLEIILRGQSASPGIATGHVCIIHSPKELKKVKKGNILVTVMTSPDFVPVMKLAAAIITDRGGVTSHAAIVSRELGLPCIVGTEKATKILKDGEVITVNGREGIVYKGKKVLLGKSEKNDTEIIPAKNIKTATKIYLNLGEVERAKELASLPSDGIGLLRAEFMIAEIGIHPRQAIAQRKQRDFINKLAKSLNTFCEAFDNRPVIYRTSDFKTNEYRNLVGGKDYEPQEANPMLGFRGAYRYIADPEVFELELAAIKNVRKKFKNLYVMVPYVRTPQEFLEVKRIMASSGLLRSPTFKIWLMVELPINVILIEDFLKVGVDGISIGSNDLTMLILGTDRDNNEVAQAFNELNPAVYWSLKRVIKACQKYTVTSSICGQAISTYDSLVEDLVKLGITSVSVNPDAFSRVQKIVQETEHNL